MTAQSHPRRPAHRALTARQLFVVSRASSRDEKATAISAGGSAVPVTAGRVQEWQLPITLTPRKQTIRPGLHTALLLQPRHEPARCTRQHLAPWKWPGDRPRPPPPHHHQPPPPPSPSLLLLLLPPHAGYRDTASVQPEVKKWLETSQQHPQPISLECAERLFWAIISLHIVIKN